jgi:hypothetical protein
MKLIFMETPKHKLAFCLLLICIAFNYTAFAQNGTYMCSSQGYTKVDNSVNKLYADKMIITIDISPVLGGTISISNLTQDFNFRYDILSKDQTVANKTDRTITTTYKAKMNQLNLQVGDDLLIGIIESMDNVKLGFWVYQEKFKAHNQYLNLTKIK